MMTFEQFFTTASGGNRPYAYQRWLAEYPACQSRLIEIPTGLGKTAADERASAKNHTTTIQ